VCCCCGGNRLFTYISVVGAGGHEFQCLLEKVVDHDDFRVVVVVDVSDPSTSLCDQDDDHDTASWQESSSSSSSPEASLHVTVKN
jgi:hypothetical protein